WLSTTPVRSSRPGMPRCARAMWDVLRWAPPARPVAAGAAAPWFSPLVGLTAPVAQVLREPHPRLPSQLPVPTHLPRLRWPQPPPPLLLRWPHPPVLAPLPGLTRLPVPAPPVLAWRQLVATPLQ